MSKKKVKFRYPKEGGRTLVKVSESSSGWVTTMPGLTQGKDIHITHTKEIGAVGKHITEIQDGQKTYTQLGKVTAEGGRRSAAFFAKHDVPSDGSEDVYVLQADLFDKAPSPKPENLPGPDLVPAPPIMQMFSNPDFSDAAIWKPTTLGESGWGLRREGDDTVFLVRRPNGKACRLPVGELAAAMPIIAGETGIGAYVVAALKARDRDPVSPGRRDS